MANRKMKEYYTITLDGIPVGTLGGFLHETLGICGAAVERSHFYAAGAGDFTYSDALDMNAYFSERHSATLYVKAIRFDRAYRAGTCLIFSDGRTALLECDIEDRDFDTKKLPDLEEWLKAQVHDDIAEFVSISYTFDNKALFEYGEGGI